jgi:L-amino acid N-acyltransferase YncA
VGRGGARYGGAAARPHAAEAAVSVIDAMQGRGLGGLLLRRLCHRAAQNGIRVFTAELLTNNHTMLHLFEKLGTVRVTGREGAELHIDVELQVADSPTLELALRSAATGHIGRRVSPDH